MILPICHNISNEEIAEREPALRTIESLPLDTPMDHLVQAIVDKVKDEPARQTSTPPAQSERRPTASEERGFGVFYVTAAGAPEPEPIGPVSKRDTFPFQPRPAGWVSVVQGDTELEYVLEDGQGRIRIRIDWGNMWSGDEIAASSLMNGYTPFALLIRLASGGQRYYPSLVNTSPSNWMMGRGNPSSWMVFQASP